MKALMVQGPGELAWVEAPDPQLATAASALVRPIASASCDLDRRLIAGTTPFKPPFALGHECVAEVLEVGSAVRNLRRGDLVSVPWKIACGSCAQCLAGRSSACTAVPRMAAYGVPAGGHWGGLFSEMVLVPFADAMLVPLPAGLDPVAVSSASDNLTDAWVAASRPLATRQEARAAGAASVDYLDDHPLRQQLAARSGAGVGLEGRDLDRSYDLVISATRDHQALRRGLLALAPGGHCSCIGIIFDDPKIPLFDLYLRDVTFSVGACSVQQHIPKVLDLVHSGCCDPLLVNPQVVSWEDAPQALIQPLTKCIVVRERIT